MDRRQALGAGLVAAATLPLGPLLAQDHPATTIDPAFAQPLLAQARRVIATFARIGEPLAAESIAAIDALAAQGDIGAAANRAAALFEQHTLLIASVTGEARVSVKQGKAPPQLVQSGWRSFLVRVDNPSMVPGTLTISSPQALPLNNLYPAGHNHGAHTAPNSAAPVSAGDATQRWLDLEVFDAAPLPATLDPLPVNYRLVSLYARDAGRMSAQLFADIGPLTGDIGDRGYADVAFAVVPAQTVTLGIRDEHGKAVTAALLIRDTLRRIVPAQTKRALPDLYFQPQVYRADGQTLTLTPGEYEVRVTRGPEYLVQQSTRAILAQSATRWDVKLSRWIDPRLHGYYSGDHHVHAAGCSHFVVPTEGVPPEVMIPQVAGEDLAIAAVLNWGPGYYTQKQYFSGADNPFSKPGMIVHYDLEVSGFPSSHCGHLVFLQLKETAYPGAAKIEDWPSSNTPMFEWARPQGAVVGYAHSGWGLWAETTDLPNYKIPPFDSIGANDYIVTVTAGLVDFISMVSTPPAAELNIWYHTLNAGYRTRISGETDWPCIYDERMGIGRSYVKIDGKLTYAGWVAGVKAGRAYVSEGRTHLMNFAAAAAKQKVAVGGADIVLEAPEPVQFKALLAARLEAEPTEETEAIRALGPLDKPYWHIERARIGATRKVLVELIVNGYPAESRMIDADGAERPVRFEFTPTQSCWVALRVAHGAHTNPIWVTIANKPVRVAHSIIWCRQGVDVCWSQKKLRIRAGELAAEEKRYEAARAIYDLRLKEVGA